MLIPKANAQDFGEFTCTSSNSIFCPSKVSGKQAAASVNQTFTLILSFLTIIAGLGFLTYFVISALKWLTAGGDSQKVEAAQQGMTNALIGLIIVVAAYGISWVVGEVLGLELLNPADSLIKFMPEQSYTGP